MAGPGDPSGEAMGPPSPVAAFVRARAPEIADAWVQAVFERPAMRDVEGSILPARISPLLTALARAPDDLPALESIGRELALARFAEGLDLTELVAQYAILRDLLIDRWSKAAAPADSWPGARSI